MTAAIPLCYNKTEMCLQEAGRGAGAPWKQYRRKDSAWKAHGFSEEKPCAFLRRFAGREVPGVFGGRELPRKTVLSAGSHPPEGAACPSILCTKRQREVDVL